MCCHSALSVLPSVLVLPCTGLVRAPLVLCRPYWRCYYSNTDAVIYVVDSCDRDRIGISKSELVAMLEVSRHRAAPGHRVGPA